MDLWTSLLGRFFVWKRLIILEGFKNQNLVRLIFPVAVLEPINRLRCSEFRCSDQGYLYMVSCRSESSYISSVKVVRDWDWGIRCVNGDRWLKRGLGLKLVFRLNTTFELEDYLIGCVYAGLVSLEPDLIILLCI